jgi:hypothetical protein
MLAMGFVEGCDHVTVALGGNTDVRPVRKILEGARPPVVDVDLCLRGSTSTTVDPADRSQLHAIERRRVDGPKTAAAARPFPLARIRSLETTDLV